MRPLVSIVIPVCNAEQFLERTLLSAQQQTYDNLEIIIVNDGSTDSSGEIAAKHALSDQRIKIINQHNSGVAFARNAGLRFASGDYVAFLDADDIWHPTKIARQMEVLLSSTGSTGWGSVYPLQRYIDTQDRVLSSGRFWSEAGDVAAHLVTLRTECGSKILTRRELALAVGGYDTTLSAAQDLDFELSLAARGPMFVVSEYLVGYRRGQDSMSSNDARLIRALRVVIKKHVNLNRLSKSCSNWALGELYKHFFSVFLVRHKFGSATKSMIGLVWNDPVIALRVLFYQIVERISQKITSMNRRTKGYQRPPDPQFYDVSPLTLFRLPKPTGRWDPSWPTTASSENNRR